MNAIAIKIKLKYGIIQVDLYFISPCIVFSPEFHGKNWDQLFSIPINGVQKPYTNDLVR